MPVGSDIIVDSYISSWIKCPVHCRCSRIYCFRRRPRSLTDAFALLRLRSQCLQRISADRPADHLLSGRLSALLSCNNKHKRIVGRSRLACFYGQKSPDGRWNGHGCSGHVSRSDKTRRKRITFSTLLMTPETLLVIYFIFKGSSRPNVVKSSCYC